MKEMYKVSCLRCQNYENDPAVEETLFVSNDNQLALDSVSRLNSLHEWCLKAEKEFSDGLLKVEEDGIVLNPEEVENSIYITCLIINYAPDNLKDIVPLYKLVFKEMSDDRGYEILPWYGKKGNFFKLGTIPVLEH